MKVLIFILCFMVSLSGELLITHTSDLNKLKNNSNELKNLFKIYNTIKIIVSNNNWIGTINLPTNVEEGSILEVKRTSNWSLRVSLTDRVIKELKKGESINLIFTNNRWNVRRSTIIDNTAPVFTSSSTASVNENQTGAITLSANDTNTGNSNPITYSISGVHTLSGRYNLPFNINSSTGVVTFKIAPDYEIQNSYKFMAFAKDSKNNTATQSVTININDIDETSLKIIDKQIDLNKLKNNSNELKNLFKIYNTIKIRLSNANWIGTINLPTNVGEGSILEVKRTSNWSLRVSLTDRVIKKLKKGESINLIFTNNRWNVRRSTIIDNTAPVFTSSSTASVNENQTGAITLSANDTNTGNSNPITYSISGVHTLSGRYNLPFNINSSTGVVTFKIAPDYEIQNSYKFMAFAKDSKNNTATQSVTININDIDEGESIKLNIGNVRRSTIIDNTAPVFTSSSTASVNENQTGAITLSANDTNTGNSNPITYSISGVHTLSGRYNLPFNINSSTGVVTFKIAPDYEIQNSYKFMAFAKDSKNNTATQSVTININDIDETSLKIIDKQIDLNKLKNNSNELKNLFKIYNTIKIRLSNANWIRYIPLPFKVRENSILEVKRDSGYAVRLIHTNNDEYDLRKGESINLIFTNNRWNVRRSTIIDNTAPVFTSSSTASVNENQTGAITLSANDTNTGNSNPITYSISGVHTLSGRYNLPFNINSSTGVVTFKIAPDYEIQNSYKFMAFAKDSKNNTATQSVTININDIDETSLKIIDKQIDLNKLKNNSNELKNLFKIYNTIKIRLSNANWIRYIPLPFKVRENSILEVKRDSGYAVRLIHTNNDEYDLRKGESINLIFTNNRWNVQGNSDTSDNPQSFIQENMIENNLDGVIEGMVQFAQTHTIFPNNNYERDLPRLVANRMALFIFIPINEDVNDVFTLRIVKTDGIEKLFTLNKPSLQPKTAKRLLFRVFEETPDVQYHNKAWTIRIPSQYIHPGVKMFISTSPNDISEIKDIDVGAPNELIIYNIRVGMLTPHRSLAHNPESNDFEGSLTLAKDYFNKIPVSKLIVANYAPITFDKVVLPTGEIYTEYSLDNNAGWHSGDMRKFIAKKLVSTGINNANYGEFSSSSYDYVQSIQDVNLLSIHRTQGKYINKGIVVHGGSGGDAIVTLESNIGNEFSHELGHVYKLGHYPDLIKSIHNQNSGWAYDIFNNKFLTNFLWGEYLNEATKGKYSVGKFLNYRYLSDSMASGVTNTYLSKYTFHTGNTMKHIQRYFESLAIFDSTFPSAYKIWNESRKEMVNKITPRKKAIKYGVNVTTIVGYYDPHGVMQSYIYPALHGNYGNVYAGNVEFSGSFENNDMFCFANVSFKKAKDIKYLLPEFRIDPDLMNQIHINLDSSKNPINVSIACKLDDMMLFRTNQTIEQSKLQPQTLRIITSD